MCVYAGNWECELVYVSMFDSMCERLCEGEGGCDFDCEWLSCGVWCV